ncbi:MAG: hypothetical protein C4339_05985 [Nitrososphaerota archaeon]
MLHLIIKGEPCRGEELRSLALSLGAVGATVSKAYLSDPSTYRLGLTFLDSGAPDLNLLKERLGQAGFTVVQQVQ